MSVLGAILSQSFEEWVASQSGAYWVGETWNDTVTLSGGYGIVEHTLYGEGDADTHILLYTSTHEVEMPHDLKAVVKESGPGFVTFELEYISDNGWGTGAVVVDLGAVFIPVRNFPTV